MGFSNQERINFNAKVLAAGVIDANEIAQWYESRFPNEFAIDPANVLLDIASVPIAGDLVTAQANALGNPTLIDDFSAPANAIRLTAIPGLNGSTYAAYSIYNDLSSSRLKHWIQPQRHPQASGVPSIGYAVQLYQGDPNGGGVLINTSDGQTGVGVTASPAWIYNYDTGMLFLSTDFRTTVTDPYILAFRYIGGTFAGGGLTNHGSDTVVATGAANETFTSFFTNTPIGASVQVTFNGVRLAPTGFTISTDDLTMVDLVNGYPTETGDIITAYYQY